MFWIEQWLGVAPDAGTGTLEWAIAVGLLTLLACLAQRRAIGRREPRRWPEAWVRTRER